METESKCIIQSTISEAPFFKEIIMKMPLQFKGTNPIRDYIAFMTDYGDNKQLVNSKPVHERKTRVTTDLCHCPECDRVFSMFMLRGEKKQTYYPVLPKTQPEALCVACGGHIHAL